MNKGAGPSRVWVPARVLVAVDGSQQARAAFEWYLNRFHQTGNTLLMAHVGEPSQTAGRNDQPVASAVPEVMHNLPQLKQPFNERMDAIGVPYSWHSGEGDVKPGPAMCHIALQQEADYIVMGMRGLGALRRLVLGSVSHHVLHNAHCPVIIHRDKSHPPKESQQ